MSTNDANNDRRAPRNYRFSTNERNTNELNKKDDATETTKTEEKSNYQVHLPDCPNTHNVRQNNQLQTNEAKKSNPISNEEGNKNQENEKTNLIHTIKHRKRLHRSRKYKSEHIISRPIQPSNQTKPNQQPNLPHIQQSSKNQAQLAQYQQKQTTKQEQQPSQTSQSSTNQSHLPQFQPKSNFYQNPVQSSSNQQQQPQPVQNPRFIRKNTWSIPNNNQSTFSESKQNLNAKEKVVNWPFHSNKLPQNYIPKFYDLYLNFAKDPNKIEGSVTITFEKKEKKDFVFLNVDINISILSVIQNGTELEYAVKYPFLLIYQSNKPETEISSYPITINYIVQPYNTIKRSPWGRSKNDEDEKGLFTYEGAYMTHFEPNNTRKLLPCFDEPYPKAVFKVRLRIPSKFKGITNMPVESIQEKNEEKEVVFQKTPPMCAYLLCICVGPFTSIQGKTKSGLPIKIYAVNSKKPLFNEFLKVSIFVVEWFENKFKASFDLPHLQIVSHNGFRHYAMENYGLITCPDESEWMRIDGKFVITHEIIHQWFGDSVSIKWWDSIWLNEGFASFLEYIIMEEYGYDGDIWLKFTHFKSANALTYFDNGVISPSSNDIDFENMFDQLLYSKGAYIVKMFYDIIGREDFFKFCTKWLHQFKNQSVSISDFLSFVNKTLNKDYSYFFNPWLKNVGFPFLVVDEIKSEEKRVGIKISQKMTHDVCYHFKVPIMYGKNGKSNLIEVNLDELTKTVEIEFDWVIVNYNIGSLCYVCYSDTLLKELIRLSMRDEINKYNIFLINKSNERKQMIQFRSHVFSFAHDPFE